MAWLAERVPRRTAFLASEKPISMIRLLQKISVAETLEFADPVPGL
jgi:hypothetical protein